MNLNDIRLAQILGYAGALPFLAGAAAVALGIEAVSVGQALRAYGAMILSFLGAVHWGIALRSKDQERQSARLAWSVAPALTGWTALLAEPVNVSIMILISGFAAAYAIDRMALSHNILPPWYGRLRLHLTVIVIACLITALFIPPAP